MKHTSILLAALLTYFCSAAQTNSIDSAAKTTALNERLVGYSYRWWAVPYHLIPAFTTIRATKALTR